MSNVKTETLQLTSPYGGEPAIFNVHVDVKIPDETNEIIQIIKFIGEETNDVKEIIESFWYSRKQLNSEYENLKNLCEEFNKWSSKMRATTALTEKTRCSKKQIKYLMSLIYNRAVQEPGKLNQYEAFSPEVYGETGFDIIDQMLNRVPLGANDIFLDLGSGVGNVVLHVAAVSNCKVCYGFEKAEWPAKYAELMEKEFIFWMNFFGKSYSNFKIYKADFLSDDEPVTIDTVNPPRSSTMNEYVREIINDAKLVFVNNYAFGAEVDHQLKLRFCNMTEGSFIISSKPFCPLNFRINSRNLNDIGTIINFSDFEPLSGHVSWTDKIINYYFQKIDRTLLEKYFEKRKNPLSCGKKDDDATKSSKLHSPTGSTSSSSTSYSYGSTSPSSSHSNQSDLLSPLNENHESSNGTRRKRDKSKDPKKKRKATHSYSGESNSPPPRNHHSKKNSNVKESKHSKKSDASLTNPSKLKIRPKSVEKTLDKMRANINKKSSYKAETLLKLSQTAVSSTTAPCLVVNGVEIAHKNVSKNFNLNFLTSLPHSNLNDQLFKDLKVIPHKKLSQNTPSTTIANNSERVTGPNRKNDNLIKSQKLNEDFDEKKMRNVLGDKMVNAVEDYFKKVKNQYYRYLCHLASPEYQDKIRCQIKTEKKLNRELLEKEENLKQNIEYMRKVNVDLLKQRAFELGIKNLKTPHELINYAQEILAEHQKLLIKKEEAEKVIEQLELKCQRDNHHLSKKIKLETDINNPSTIYKTQQQKTTILNKLLNVIDSKNVENLNANSNANKNGNHKGKSNGNVAKTMPYELHFSSEKENLNSVETSGNPSKIREDQVSVVNSVKSPLEDEKSVESLSTHEGTLTATERGDDENDEALYDIATSDINTDETSEDRSPQSLNHDDSNPTPNHINNINNSNNVIKKKTNATQAQPTTKHHQSKDLTHMCSTLKGGSDTNLKNFKIPKQNNKVTTTANIALTKIKNEPETLISILSDHFGTNSKIPPSLLTNCESPSLSISSVNSQNDYPPSSSSSSSPSISTTMNSFDFNNQKSTNYYHPKKSQFRQYMMESSSSTTVINDNNNSTNTSNVDVKME